MACPRSTPTTDLSHRRSDTAQRSIYCTSTFPGGRRSRGPERRSPGRCDPAALFPPTLLTALSNGQLYEHVLLEFLAGASTYLLFRRLSVARLACLAAAIAFALNGTFAWFAHAPVNPVAFLPMLVLGIEFAYDASVKGRRGGWWLIALAGALSVYGGFPETAYIDSLLAAAWFAWRCWTSRRTIWRPFLVKGLTGAVVGTLLTAPLLIPAVNYVHHGDLGIHAGTADRCRSRTRA